MIRTLLIVSAGLLTWLLAGHFVPDEQEAPKIPSSISSEHQALHEELVAATKISGPIGEAARTVADLLHAHFEREEQIAMPPLGLLVPLSQGKVTPEMKSTITLCEALRAELPKMLREHEAIKAAVEKLASAAKNERNQRVQEFAARLALHAKNEEEVLYPATIVIGDYLKLKLK